VDCPLAVGIRRAFLLTVAANAILALLAGTLTAQELEPRAYAPIPTGTNFFVISAARASGSVLFDPSVPVQDVHSTSGALGVGLGRSFDLFGRQALLVGALPWARSTATGKVFDSPHSVTRIGLADARLKLSMILFGSDPLPPRAFARQPRRPTFGVSVTVAAPTGQYVPEHLINLGTNRWGFKPEVGISFPRKKWTLEAYGGGWFFTQNNEFYPGSSSRTQSPIGSVQGHVGYSFRPDIWVAFDATWYAGGRTDVNGVPKADFQKNSRAGLTFALPVAKRQSLKFAYNTGATTTIGGDYDTVSLSYQLVWFDKPRPTTTGQGH
jgi:hypothetical protein